MASMIHPNESATFAALIESRMGTLQLDQVELERRSLITDTSWARWRAGKLPSIKAMFPAIASALEVELADLEAVLERDRAARSTAGKRIDTVEDTRAWVAKQDPTPIEQGG
jgi:hypothetical protein